MTGEPATGYCGLVSTHTNERVRYRRRLQQRQTVVFGGLAIILSVLMLLSLAWWTGILPFPLDRGFTSSEQEGGREIVPCIAEGTPAVSLEEITVNVYNGTNRNGLASAVGSELTALGVTVGQEANWRGATPTHPVIIYTSSAALPQAYTIARVFPEATVLLDTTTQSGVLDLVLGDDFTDIHSEDELAQLEAGQPLSSPENCEPVDQ